MPLNKNQAELIMVFVIGYAKRDYYLITNSMLTFPLN